MTTSITRTTMLLAALVLSVGFARAQETKIKKVPINTYTSFGKVYTIPGGGGGTHEWHLMKTVIGDKLYGLAA